MNYERIPTLEECKQICNDCKAFSHSTQTIYDETIHSFKYNTTNPKIWEDTKGLGRINMRGITYDNQGKLLALPFPKFFNNGEIKETKDLDIRQSVRIAEKMDGSLISFFKVNDVLEVKTMKSVESEVANAAREFLHSKCAHIKDFASSLIDDGLSPMFEYISPLQPIVVNYDKEDFVFLGARCMQTARLYMPSEFETGDISIPRVFSHEIVEKYLEEERNIEGLVFTMPDGLMFKMKSEEYVKAHRAGSNLTGKKYILSLIINNEIDDVKGILSKNKMALRLQQIKETEDKYEERFSGLEEKAEAFTSKAKTDGKGRKDIAFHFGSNPTLFGTDTKMIKTLTMLMFDGREYSHMINNNLLKECNDW